DAAIRLQPENARAYLLRGNLRQSQDDLRGAAEDFQEAIRLDPALAEMLRNQGYEAETGSEANILPFPGRGGDHDEPDDTPIHKGVGEPALPGAIPGLRSWVQTGLFHGIVAGAFFGVVPEALALLLALLVYTPLFLGLFLSRFWGVRRSVLAGVLL